jgi:hypothetical protein
VRRETWRKEGEEVRALQVVELAVRKIGEKSSRGGAPHLCPAILIEAAHCLPDDD